MNRTERRAAARQELKLARKAGFHTPQPTIPASAPAPINTSTEPPTKPPHPPSPANKQVKPPISPAQLTANRANSQLSTGPVTSAGRAISSQNHTTHGLARHNGAFKILSTEDPHGFKALKTSLAAEHQPITETECILVNTMAESHWLANRAQNLQACCVDQQTGQITHPQLFSLYIRYQTTHTRAFHKSLNDLLKLRAEKRKAENGFEAQNRQQEDLRLKTEKHEMSKQTHDWDILRKDSEACFRIGQTALQNSKASAENPGFEAQYAAELAKRGFEPHPWRGLARTAA